MERCFMDEKTVDDLVRNIVTHQQLREEGINLSALGINLRLASARSFYVTKQGITVEMEDGTYLTAKDLRQYVEKCQAHGKYDGTNIDRDVP